MTKVSSGPSSVRQIGECGAGRSEGECEDEGEPGLRLSFFFFMPTVDGGAVRVWFCLLLVDAATETTVCVCMCVCVCVCKLCVCVCMCV